MRLNKYIAHAGVCSRRDADQMIADGKVTVNGKVVTEMGHKVSISDRIVVDGAPLKLEPHVYILLNKGRDTISTTSDERGRATVIDAIEDATGYRVYPVGRLDRNTTGLLLLTNDGDLAHRLMHPSHKVGKTYEATTDRPLADEELQQLRLGVMLEDGPAKATSVKRKEGDPFTLRLTVQEGRNHLVRRMIAYLGGEVMRLKRTTFGGLNDRELRLGRWRYLRNEEVEALRRLVKGVPGPSNGTITETESAAEPATTTSPKAAKAPAKGRATSRAPKATTTSPKAAKTTAKAPAKAPVKGRANASGKAGQSGSSRAKRPSSPAPTSEPKASRRR